MGPWDPGPKWRDPNAGTQVLGPKLSGLECSGPKCWDPPSRDPNEGTQIPGPIERSEAHYGSRKVGGTLWVPRLEALKGSPKVWGTLQVPRLEVPFFTPMSSTILLKNCKLIAFPANNYICLWNYTKFSIHWHQIQLCSLKSVYIELVRDSKPFSNSASMEIELKQKLHNLSLLFFVNIHWPYCDM